MGVAVMCLIAPIRTCIARFVDEEKALNNDKEYSTLVSAFPTDYDKENPLTIKKGQLRILQL